jgi:hypothetical protein
VVYFTRIFLPDVLPKLISYEKTADVTGGMPSAILLQSISGLSAINPLVTFYDIHGGKRAILLFCPGQHTRLNYIMLFCK